LSSFRLVSANAYERSAEKQENVALAVPSVAAPEEFNYLLNPNHPDFQNIGIGMPRPIHWDS
jgi:RES domain-containing protein